jgi:hypothetical protein
MWNNSVAINHFRNHINNSNVNYILLENCPYCKLEKRLNYGNNLNRITRHHSFPSYRNTHSDIDTTNVSRNNYQINRTLPIVSVERHLPRVPVERHLPRVPVERYIPRVPPERYVPRRFYARNQSDNVLNYNRQYQILNYRNLEDIVVYTDHMTVNQHSELNLCRHDNVLCVVCQENMNKNDIVRKLSCNHYFHHRCIDKWLETNKKCPLCNYELT